VCPLLTSPALPPSPSTPLPLPAALPIYPSVRLGDFYPPHRLRLIGPAPQLFPNGWPVLFQVSRKFVNGHAVHARTPFVGLDSCQDRKSTRLNSSHVSISYPVLCWKKKSK